MVRLSIYFFCCIALSSCSSLNNKTLLYGAGSFIACSLIGSHKAPKDEDRDMHGALYGGLCSTAAMAINEIVEDRSKEHNRTIQKLEKKKIKDEQFELDVRRKLLNSKSIQSLDKSIQENLKGNWDAYSKSEWIFDGEKLIHEDLEIKFKEGEE